MPLQAITAAEPIPGYRICERIGAGGYGEVWRADAPGGLVKAIKFVYGFLSEDRASRELKALNRIKGVRHPFLLSLERIEVVDGQLLIVTELADSSLKDRFDECQQQGQVGIEWEELIRYMRDAADVLDYMSEEHSLQHLDIKPENVLLLADRVKVADFGLVKDIHDATASMMGGLTPLYAPPEVFDGRPSRWSDQYSLAIVYQEMLTGELPFPGTTAIQLARQHLNARPRLSALPERDQEVIARALSKSPQDRFDSCREMVDALQRAAADESARHASTQTGDSSAPEPREQKRHTEVLDDVPTSGKWFDESDAVPLPRIRTETEVRDLTPIDLDQESLSIEPTLFLGIGRTGGRVLLRLRSRLADRFGLPEDLPALQMLLLDTDAKDLLQASHHELGLRPRELFGMALRRPQDYRTDSPELLRWLSRRWLYNIPRSLKTEGMRPLGRLALVDHAEDVIQRMRTAIETAVSDESLQQSQQATGVDFVPGKLRIVVVASIAGGTGSGVVADVGYLCRHVLGRLGLPDGNVCSILTHSTSHNPRTAELAAVNTYAALMELNHYSRLGSGYPGERACHLPARKDDNLAFRDTYLIHMGEGLSDEQYEQANDQIAEYLYLDTATAATQFFRACRDQEPRHADTRNAEIPVRSFGLHQYSCLQDDVISIAIEHLCRSATDRWIAGQSVEAEPIALRRTSVTLSQHADRTHEPAYAHLRLPVEELANTLTLDVDALIEQISQVVEKELGGTAEGFMRRQLDELLGLEAPASREELQTRVSEVFSGMDQLLGARQDAAESGRPAQGSLECSLAPVRRNMAAQRVQSFRSWIMERIEDENDRIRGAQWATQWFAKHCLNLERRIAKLRKSIHEQVDATHQRLEAATNPHGRGKERESFDAVRAMLEQFCRLRLYECVTASATSIVQVIKGQVSSAEDELMDLDREVRNLAGQFDTSRTLDSANTAESDDLADSIGKILADNASQLAADLVQKLAEEVVQPAGGLRDMLMKGGNERNMLPAVMRSVARATVVSTIRQLDASDILFQNEDASQSEIDMLTECLQAARPRLLDCGGAKRLLVMLPKGSSQVRPIEILHQQMHETPSVVENCDGDFILCYETEQISLTQAAVTLVDGRRDLVEAATRLHTRGDVAWSHLPDLE